MYLLLCLHLLIILDLLFSMVSSLCRAIASFSLRHRRGDIVQNFVCMISGFPKFPRICWRFCLLILYSNIRLIVLYQFGIWCCWMFSYGSHIWPWILFRKCHNEFLLLDFLRLLWYLLAIVHYWLGIFHWVGINVFLYSCMSLQY